MRRRNFFMEFVIGIILVLTFFGLAYYCVKGHNLMIGFHRLDCPFSAGHSGRISHIYCREPHPAVRR